MNIINCKEFTVFAIAFIIATSIASAQDALSANKIKDLTENYGEDFPVEKAYLQLDKSLYVPGETVWMKGYVVKEAYHLLSDISGVLYVDLIDRENRILEQNIVYVANGEAAGDFTLDENLPSGTYQIRAYTQWMQNFDQMFQTSITVLGREGDQRQDQQVSKKPDVQFLPEGGNLLSGIEQTIAYKAIGISGLGVDVKGDVLDQSGKTVTSFVSTHIGMGKFSFIPVSGNTYTARIMYNGENYTYPIPEVESSGWNISVERIPQNFEITVHSLDIPQGSYLLTGTVRDEIFHSQSVSISSNEEVILIPQDKFPTGVVVFTLHSSDGLALSERLVFNDRDDELRVFLSTNQSIYSQRDKVEVEITASDGKGNPVQAPFSIAVTQTDGLWESQPDRETILSHLWLSSDLSGFVEQAPMYFRENGFSQEELDLVMLTHGWRGFEWERVLSDETVRPEYYMEQGLSISGQVFEANNREVLDEGKITLVVDNVLNTFVTEADDQGRFGFMNIAFLDTTQIFLQARTAKNKKREVTFALNLPDTLPVRPYLRLDGYFSNEVNVQNKTEYLLSSNQYVRQQELFDGIAQYELGTVQIVAQAPEEEENRRNQLYSRADYSIDAENLPQNLTVLNALQGRVPGVNIYGGLGNPRVSIRGAFRGQPLFLIDGIPTDISFIESIPMADVDRIDVLKGPSAAIYGGRGGNGVIAVYTKTGEDSGRGGVPDEDQPGIIRPELPGFHVAKIFYAPQYESEASPSQVPDLRNTVYWNPVVRTDKNGKAFLSFFNSDLRGEYQITIEGISVGGIPGRAEKIYEVR